jgi:hypothetical protein
MTNSSTQTHVELANSDTEEISIEGDAGVDIAELIAEPDEEDDELMPAENLAGIEVIVLSSELESTSYVDVVNTFDEADNTLVDITEVVDEDAADADDEEQEEEITLTPDGEGDTLDTALPSGLVCRVVLTPMNNILPNVAEYRRQSISYSSNMSVSSDSDDTERRGAASSPRSSCLSFGTAASETTSSTSSTNTSSNSSSKTPR